MPAARIPPPARILPPLAAALLLALPPGAAAQAPLTLGEALRRADRSAYANRIAAGEIRARAGQASGTLRTFLPTVRIENLWTRTTDPLGSFGFILRQRTVTQASFAPDRLNAPDPISNFGAGLVLEQPLINLDGFFGRRAALRAREASEASAAWTRTTTRTDVVRAYYGAVLASAQVATLDTARRAAEAHVRQAESLVRNGLATRSDALLASVRAGEISARLASARGDAALAARRLAVTMGTPEDTGFALPSSLPDAARVRQLAAGVAADSASPAARADVRAASLALSAAEADARRAGSLLLPRINSFGRLDWNSGSTPYGGKEAWTVGLAVSWTPFGGGSELGERRAAAGRRASAAASAEAAVAQAALEAAQAHEQLRAALQRLDIAERAVEQSAEAHRIVSRKYAGGVASVVELFDAVAAETGSRLAFEQGRFDAIAAAAARRQALGLDLALLEDLDQ
ncbi:MAG TPA: TolC family protein [Gemmatimonadales bacterium]|nr:TolC family protein [Gemmatimonadales bacterium]